MVRIPPEAAHFSLKKGKWVVSSVVVLCCVACHLHCLTTFLISSTVYSIYVECLYMYQFFMLIIL